MGWVTSFCFGCILLTTETVGSIFYFGFLLGEFAWGPVIQKVPIGKLFASTVLSWGIIVVLLGAAQNAAGLMTLRFLMGFAEAPLYPMCSVITVMWYKKSEQPLRVTIWFTSLSSVGNSLISPDYVTHVD